MTSAWSITAAAHPPRAVFLDFPLGHTTGRPGRPAEQVSIMRDALAAFASISEPGTILPLTYSWGTPWKDQARELIDHRTPRHDTPQYQTEQDRLAAVVAHGDSVACGVCEPEAVPTH